MKYNLQLIIIFLCVNIITAQETKGDTTFTENKIYLMEQVDEIPLFNNCTISKGKQALDCFNKEMNAHVRKYFNYPERAREDNIQGKVIVKIIINTDGSVAVTAVGPNFGSMLEEETIKIFKLLPPFKPAKLNDKLVPVSYTFPIMFKLDNTSTKKKKNE